MNILFLNSMKGMGGGEKWLLESACAMRQRGHRVSVGGRRGRPLVRTALREGFPVVEAPFAFDMDPVSVLAVRAALRSRKIEIVVSQIQRAHRIGVLAVWNTGIPLVLRVGQTWPVRRGWANRRAWAGLSGVIANCEAVRSWVLDSGVVPDVPLLSLRNTVEAPLLPSRLRARESLGILPDVPVALCVARLARRKGHLTLLHAWKRVLERRPEALLLLAGAGSERELLERTARALGVADGIRFLGEIPDLAATWAASDVFVLPSELEGSPNALLEAMAAGLPSVATAIAGVPELLDPEVHGLLVPPRDPVALAGAMERILGDPHWGARLGGAARTRALRDHAAAPVQDRLEHWLADITCAAGTGE